MQHLALFAGVSLVVAGAVLARRARRSVALHAQALSWPVVQGVVVGSELAAVADSDGTTYRADIRCSYSRDGRQHTTSRHTHGMRFSAPEQSARALVAHFPVGRPVELRVDPDPSHAPVLVTGQPQHMTVIHRIGIAAVLAGLLLTVSALAAAQPLAAPPWTLSTQGYGPIRPGMTPADAERLLATRLRTHDRRPPDPECDHVYPVRGHRGISLMVQNGRITRITADSPDVATRSGARVGDPVARLQALFGPSLEVETHKYDDTGQYLTLWEPGQQRGVRFEVSGGRVQFIHAGDASIRLVEGCA